MLNRRSLHQAFFPLPSTPTPPLPFFPTYSTPPPPPTPPSLPTLPANISPLTTTTTPPQNNHSKLLPAILFSLILLSLLILASAFLFRRRRRRNIRPPSKPPKSHPHSNPGSPEVHPLPPLSREFNEHFYSPEADTKPKSFLSPSYHTSSTSVASFPDRSTPALSPSAMPPLTPSPPTSGCGPASSSSAPNFRVLGEPAPEVFQWNYRTAPRRGERATAEAEASALG